MEQIISLLPFFAVGIFGICTHIFSKLASLEKENELGEVKSVTFTNWMVKNKYRTILSFCVVACSVPLFNEMGQLNYVGMWCAGYMSDSILKNFTANSKLDKNHE